MATKVEQQYKQLNAELVDQVRKQRIEIGLYKKELIALKHEIMELREERILQSARQRQDLTGIVKALMRQLEINSVSLDSTETMEQETPFVVNRRSQSRRSSKEICQEMRQSSALASSTRTISPSRLTHTPPPRRVADMGNDTSRSISPARSRNTIGEEPNEAPELTHTPQPRRVAEIANHSSTEEEEDTKSGTNTSTPMPNKSTQKNTASRKTSEGSATACSRYLKVRIQRLNLETRKAEQSTDLSTTCFSSSGRPSRKCRPTQLSESYLKAKMWNSSVTSTEEEEDTSTLKDDQQPIAEREQRENIQPRQVLRPIDPNVSLEGSGKLTRGMYKPTKSFTLDSESTNEEHPSIQLPRLLLTQASPTALDSLMSSSYFALETSKLSPRGRGHKERH